MQSIRARIICDNATKEGKIHPDITFNELQENNSIDCDNLIVSNGLMTSIGLPSQLFSHQPLISVNGTSENVNFYNNFVSELLNEELRVFTQNSFFKQESF